MIPRWRRQPILPWFILMTLLPAVAAGVEYPASSEVRFDRPADANLLLQLVLCDPLVIAKVGGGDMRTRYHPLRDWKLIAGDRSRLADEMSVSFVGLKPSSEDWYLLPIYLRVHKGSRGVFDKGWIRHAGVVRLTGPDDAFVKSLTAPAEDNLFAKKNWARMATESPLELTLSRRPRSMFEEERAETEIYVGDLAPFQVKLQNSGDHSVLVAQDQLSSFAIVALRSDGYLERGFNLTASSRKRYTDDSMIRVRTWVEIPPGEAINLEPRDHEFPVFRIKHVFQKPGDYEVFAFLALVKPSKQKGMADKAWWGNLVSNSFKVKVEKAQPKKE